MLTVAYNHVDPELVRGLESGRRPVFRVRTDLGKYSKLIFGDRIGRNGKVLQWLDDQSLDEENR